MLRTLLLGMIAIVSVQSLVFPFPFALADETPTAPFYRDLSLRVRPEGAFQIPLPGNTLLEFNYHFAMGSPIYKNAIIQDMQLTHSANFFRMFWDRLSFQDGSYLQFGNEKVPLTCMFIVGQDNRFMGPKNPLMPDTILKVYLVANDYSCTGPINPGWPSNGAKKETWDTYLYFEVRDPTIMLPTEVKVRYRWNEFQAILTDAGGVKLDAAGGVK